MRKMIAVFISVLMVFTLAACGNDEEKRPLPEENIVSDSPALPVQAEPEETEIPTGTGNMQTESSQHSHASAPAYGTKTNLSGTIPEELEYIPAEYKSPSEHPGTLEKLTYQTWESFSYEERTQELTKEAWVYLPYGYSEDQKYNVFYLSHGGWSNETTTMGIPSADGLPEWEPYTRDGGATMILDEESVMSYHHDRELMKLLEPEYEY